MSKTIEDTWLEHLKVDKDVAKKLKGRGEVKITKEVPKGREDKVKEGSIKNSLMYKAIDNLKQARRCEQINHRITKGRNEVKEKRGKCGELNRITGQIIQKKLDTNNKAEKEFASKIKRYLNGEIREEMIQPTIKLQMGIYHKEYETWKRKAVETDEKEAQKLYASKGK